MWWILFTAVDLYLGLIMLDVIAHSDSFPPEKLHRLAVAKKILVGGLGVLAVVFAVKLLR